MKLTIATRKSPLALWQTRFAAEALCRRHPGLEIELLPLSTRGDEVLDRSLAKIGGKGLFLKELEEALLDGRADLAVHSMKDVPVDMPEGLAIAAVLERHDPRDVLVAATGAKLQDLPRGARVGTSSLRRRVQLLAQRDDLEIADLRGNIHTRLAKLDRGDYDAIVLAKAGLDRMGMQRGSPLPVSQSLPAVAQGAIGMECARSSSAWDAVAALDHAPTRRVVEVERAVSRALGGSCQTPLAVHAREEGPSLYLDALVGALDPFTILTASAAAPLAEAISLADRVAAELIDQGAADLIRATEESHA